MRMLHYYLALALVLVPCLLATAWTGMAGGDASSGPHLLLGLFTAVLCVATNTLLILFMIVTGRVLKEAMRSRSLGPQFLDELNRFFARQLSYPMALGAALAATAAAVLGHGRFIGVPGGVHELFGVLAVLANLGSLAGGVSALRRNQALLDRTAGELDRLDAAAAAPPEDGPRWAFRPAQRWLFFAASAWGPYLYWSLVVWRGEFSRVAPLFPLLTALASALGLVLAWRHREARQAR